MWTRREVFPRPGFSLGKGGRHVRTKTRYRAETRLVHAGHLRSAFGETSEALFLTQGYVMTTSDQRGEAL